MTPKSRIWNAARRVYVGLRYLEGWRPAASPPRITIVTPVRNGAATIAETIDSVLSQNYPDLEYIIVDGGSTDGTIDIVRGYGDRISRVVTGRDRGMYDALNKGFYGATGRIFGYLNADDVLEPRALARVADAFARGRGAVAIYFEDVVDVNGWRFANRAQHRSVSYRDMLDGHILFQDGVFFLADAYRAVGGFDPSLKLAGDWEFFTRLRGYGRFAQAEGHVSVFRIRNGQLSDDWNGYRAEQKHSAEALLAALPVSAMGNRLKEKMRLVREASRRLRRRQLPLFFPFYGGLEQSPSISPMPGLTDAAICPATGQIAGRLLFSSPDTRFGDRELNRVYFCDATGIAVTWPRLDNDALKPLYEKHYSNAKPVLIARPGEVSPFLLFWGASRLLRRWAGIPLTHLSVAVEQPNKPRQAAVEPHLSADLPPASRRGVLRKLRTYAARAHGKARTWEKVGRLESWAVKSKQAFLRHAVPQFVDRTPDEILAAVEHRFRRDDPHVRFLDVGCFEGHLLDQLRATTRWSLDGLELNENAAAVALGKGHTVWRASAESALDVLDFGRRYDIIFLGQVIEHLTDPRAALIRLGMLLEPNGLLVMTTPNLDSWQIRLFGPSWAHWHVPYHRHLFTRRGARNLMDAAELRIRRLRTASHPYWTCLSVQQHLLGLNGAVSHNTPLPREIGLSALKLATLSKYLHDPFGRGDYLIIVAEKM
ncbi:glycosyltransferase [Bosea sp. 2RAB26]|uniref:glycosyltransferase n=1 Tax=Bosea sp. 2RAB26 TaxID=3237476 RepID=UPI003F9192B0